MHQRNSREAAKRETVEWETAGILLPEVEPAILEESISRQRRKQLSYISLAPLNSSARVIPSSMAQTRLLAMQPGFDAPMR